MTTYEDFEEQFFSGFNDGMTGAFARIDDSQQTTYIPYEAYRPESRLGLLWWWAVRIWYQANHYISACGCDVIAAVILIIWSWKCVKRSWRVVQEKKPIRYWLLSVAEVLLLIHIWRTLIWLQSFVWNYDKATMLEVRYQYIWWRILSKWEGWAAYGWLILTGGIIVVRLWGRFVGFLDRWIRERHRKEVSEPGLVKVLEGQRKSNMKRLERKYREQARECKREKERQRLRDNEKRLRELEILEGRLVPKSWGGGRRLGSE